MEADNIEQIAVVGAGTMGHGIAEVCALAGLEVGITDIKQEFLDRAMESVSSSLEKLKNKGKISESEKENILGRISTDVDLGKIVSPAELVIEAVPEKMEIKKDVFEGITASAKEEALFATNTSSLSVTNLASITDRPDQFLGLHFFNPPVRMKLVEVVKGKETSRETIDTAMDFAQKLGKKPVYCRKDSPGFIVNAILFPYLLEAVRLKDLEGMDVKNVDSGVVDKLNFPMGPFELLDMVGLDVAREIGEVIDWPLPSTLKQKVEDGELGRKSGLGFYNYEEEGVNYTSQDGKGFDPLPLLGVMINEAGKVLEKKVATADDIDLAMKLGAGLPEGPLSLGKEKGLEAVKKGLKRMSKVNPSEEGIYKPCGPIEEGFSEYEI